MKSTLKILKNNIFTIFVIIVFVVCMFAVSYIKKLYWDNNDKAAYGDRTEEAVNYVLEDKEIEDIKAKIKEDVDVISVDYHLDGRIIKLTILVKDDVTDTNARKKGESYLELFESDDLSYYSINFEFKKEDISLNDFPIEGYKHYSNKKISWIKDREATENED